MTSHPTYWKCLKCALRPSVGQDVDEQESWESSFSAAKGVNWYNSFTGQVGTTWPSGRGEPFDLMTQLVGMYLGPTLRVQHKDAS